MTVDSRQRTAALALLAAAFLGLAGAAAAGEVIERILAVVEGRPILLSETRLLQELRGVDREAALEGLIDERLMYREASRLPLATPAGDEEERAYQSLRARLGGGASTFAPEELRRVARRQTAILKYVELRFRPQVRIEEKALRQAYEAEYGGQPDAPSLEQATDSLRRRLEDEDLGQRIEAWVRELRASADVRYNDPGSGS